MRAVFFIFFNFFFIFLSASVPEKPLVIGVCSYNNAQWCEKNLQSIFMQQYENYRLIYIDDCSTDGTFEKVSAFVNASGQGHRCTLIRNPERKLALANHYQIIHSCDDNEIIVSLDGDDWFAHPYVLKKIHNAYKKNIWIVYSQFKRWPSGMLGYSRPTDGIVVKNASYRQHEWIWGQTRSYYAWLAKSIKLKDLIMKTEHAFKGRFFPSACDVALMMPMLERADGKCHFIREPLYIYNMHDCTDYRLNSTLQGYCSWSIRKQRRYKPYTKPQIGSSAQLLDVIFFDCYPSYDELRSLALQGYKDRVVLCFSNVEYYRNAQAIYDQQIQLAQIFDVSGLLKFLSSTSSTYAACVFDRNLFDVTYSELIRHLSQTKARVILMGSGISNSLKSDSFILNGKQIPFFLIENTIKNIKLSRAIMKKKHIVSWLKNYENIDASASENLIDFISSFTHDVALIF